MKKLEVIFCLAFSLFVSEMPAHAQWVQTNGPNSGGVECFAVLGSDIFVSVDDAVYLSTDKGTSWEPLKVAALTMTVQGTNVFAGGNYGVDVSTDQGATWTEVNSGLTDTYVETLAGDGANLYAGTSYGGVFLSTDGGMNWIADGLTGLEVQTICFSSGQAYAGTDSGVYVSDGTGWDRIGLDSLFIITLSASGSNLIAGAMEGTFVSQDGGKNWLPESRLNTVLSFATFGDTVFAGTQDNGVFFSSDAGMNWSQTNDGLTDTHINALVQSGNSLYAGTFTGGIFASTNEGLNWASVGIPNTSVTSFGEAVRWAGSTCLFAGTSDHGVYESLDGGRNWFQSGLSTYVVNSLFVSHESDGQADVFAAAGDRGIYMSSDYGASWAAVNSGISFQTVTCLGGNDTNLFAGTILGHLYVSSDEGANWTDVGLGATYIGSIVSSGSSVFVSTDSGVFVLPGGSLNWSKTTLTGVNVIGLGADSAELFAGTQSGLFRSTDGGSHWYQTTLADSNCYCFAFEGNNVFAGSLDGKVFLSTDGGTNWTEVDSGLPSTAVRSLLVYGSDILAGTSAYLLLNGYGVWRRPLSEMITSVKAYQAAVPLQFRLEQNFPNPFNPSTVIRFGVRSSAFVSLNVYDVLGRLVKTLVNKVEKPGSYDVVFDGTGLPSGVYFYRLEAGTYHATKKLLLLK